MNKWEKLLKKDKETDLSIMNNKEDYMYEYFLKNAVWYKEEIKALENDNKYLKELLKKDDKPIANSTMHRIAKERLLLNKSRKQNFNNELKDNLDKLKYLNDEELSKLCLNYSTTELFLLIENNNIKNIKEFTLKEYEAFLQDLNNMKGEPVFLKGKLHQYKEKQKKLQKNLKSPNEKINNTTTHEVYQILLVVNDLKIKNIKKEMEKNE